MKACKAHKTIRTRDARKNMKARRKKKLEGSQASKAREHVKRVYM